MLSINQHFVASSWFLLLHNIYDARSHEQQKFVNFSIAGVFQSEICDNFSNIFHLFILLILLRKICVLTFCLVETHTVLMVTRCMDFLDCIWGNIEAVDW
jgi:hypothetical protein